MVNKKIQRRVGSILLMCCLLIITACTTKVPQVKREKLQLELLSISYNADKNEINAEITTNLPEGTEAWASLIAPGEPELDQAEERLVIDKDKKMMVSFPIPEDSPDNEYFINGDYGIELTVYVLKDDDSDGKLQHINKHLVDDKIVGGTSEEMADEYVDSKYVRISQELEDEAAYDEDYKSNEYIINIKSQNKLPLASFDNKIKEEPAENESENEATNEEKEQNEKEYKLVTAKDLKQNYDNLVITDIQVNGEVTQVIVNDEFALNKDARSFLVNISDPNNYNASNSVWVEIIGEQPTILVGSKVNVKGMLGDPYSYESVSGQNVTVPYILADSITLN